MDFNHDLKFYAMLSGTGKIRRSACRLTPKSAAIPLRLHGILAWTPAGITTPLQPHGGHLSQRHHMIMAWPPWVAEAPQDHGATSVDLEGSAIHPATSIGCGGATIYPATSVGSGGTSAIHPATSAGKRRHHDPSRDLHGVTVAPQSTPWSPWRGRDPPRDLCEVVRALWSTLATYGGRSDPTNVVSFLFFFFILFILYF